MRQASVFELEDHEAPSLIHVHFQLMHRIDISPSKSEPRVLQRLPKLAERPLEAV